MLQNTATRPCKSSMQLQVIQSLVLQWLSIVLTRTGQLNLIQRQLTTMVQLASEFSERTTESPTLWVLQDTTTTAAVATMRLFISQSTLTHTDWISHGKLVVITTSEPHLPTTELSSHLQISPMPQVVSPWTLLHSLLMKHTSYMEISTVTTLIHTTRLSQALTSNGETTPKPLTTMALKNRLHRDIGSLLALMLETLLLLTQSVITNQHTMTAMDTSDLFILDYLS